MLNISELSYEDLQFLGLYFENEEEDEAFRVILREDLEKRVGTKLSSKLDKEKIDRFDQLVGTAEQREWVRENCPEYREIVRDTNREILKELLENRTRILGTQGDLHGRYRKNGFNHA